MRYWRSRLLCLHVVGQTVERSGFEPVLVVWFPCWCGECLMGDQPLPDNDLFTAAQWVIVIPLYEIYAALSTLLEKENEPHF